MTATPIADMVAELGARGVAIDAIVVAVRTAELSRDATRHAQRDDTAPKRSSSAIRSARHRAKLKRLLALAKANDIANAGVQSVTEERVASRVGVTDRCNLSSSLFTFENGNQKVKEGTEQVDGRKRGTRLSPNASLEAEDRQFAIDNGMQNPDAAWAEFVDYWIGVPGQRGVKLNWSATWRNRVRATATRGRPNAKPQSAIMSAIDEHIDRLERGGGSEVREVAPRVLSHR